METYKSGFERCMGVLHKDRGKSPDTEKSSAGAKAWRDRGTTVRFGESKWGAAWWRREQSLGEARQARLKSSACSAEGL